MFSGRASFTLAQRNLKLDPASQILALYPPILALDPPGRNRRTKCFWLTFTFSEMPLTISRGFGAALNRYVISAGERCRPLRQLASMEVDDRLNRPLRLVEQGLVDPNDPPLVERLIETSAGSTAVKIATEAIARMADALRAALAQE